LHKLEKTFYGFYNCDAWWHNILYAILVNSHA